MQLTTRKKNNADMDFVFSPKELNHILSNLHITKYVIVMSHTDGTLLVMRYLLNYVTAVLTGTVSVQKALAQFNLDISHS